MARRSKNKSAQPKQPGRAPWWLWALSPATAAIQNASLPKLPAAGSPGSPTGGPAGAPGWSTPPGGGAPGNPGTGGTSNLNGAAVPSNIANRSGLQNWALGTPAYTSQIPRFVPEQGQGFQSILQMALEGLGKNSMSFEPFANQARQQFATQTIPSIAERFTSMGGGGGKSSAFGQQLGAAGANLETGLAAAGGQYNLQQQKLLQTLAALGLTPQFESQSYGRQPGALEGGAQSLLSSLPLLAGLL